MPQKETGAYKKGDRGTLEEREAALPGDVKLSAGRKFLEATVLKKKWTKTDILTSICLYLHVLPWGLYCGALSTTLLDLEQLTDTTTTQIGLMFTATTVGALVGAPIGGLVLNKVDCRLVLAFVNCAYGCTTFALPWAGNFVRLIVIAVIHGFFQGALDTSQNVTALLIWGWDASSFLQAFHCVFGVGTFIGPFLTKPFLAPTWYQRVPINSTSSMNSTIMSPANDSTTNFTEVLVLGESSAQVPFAIIGCITFSSGIAYLIVYFITRKYREAEALRKCDENKVKRISDLDRYRNPNQSKKWYMIPMAIMAFIRFGLYVGIELTFSGFIMTFTVKFLGWDKTQGFRATTMYWGSFAGSRIVAIFLVLCVSPTVMVVMAMTLMLTSYLVLSIFVTSHPIVITICSLVAGAAQGSFYGCSMSWAYKYMKISELVGTIFTSGAWAGMACIPALAAYLIDTTPIAFIYMCLTIAIILAVVTYIPTVMGLKCGNQIMPEDHFEDGQIALSESPNSKTLHPVDC